MCAKTCHGSRRNHEWKVAVSTRTNKRRIYAKFDSRFNGKPFWRSAEEQAWLDVAPVGREFGSADYERLQILDMYEAGQLTAEAVMLKLGINSLEDRRRQMHAAGLAAP